MSGRGRVHQLGLVFLVFIAGGANIFYWFHNYSVHIFNYIWLCLHRLCILRNFSISFVLSNALAYLYSNCLYIVFFWLISCNFSPFNCNFTYCKLISMLPSLTKYLPSTFLSVGWYFHCQFFNLTISTSCIFLISSIG